MTLPPVSLQTTHALIAASVALLVLGTVRVLVRKWREQRPPLSLLLMIAACWCVALVLRLTVSPRNFLHEFYHIQETVLAYQNATIPQLYGETGPALYRFVGTLLGNPESVEVIFLVNAVVASLAVPALALLDLVLFRSRGRALAAAVLLCFLPQHLRFSAAEDLFVVAVTFTLWASALFVHYLDTRRLDDAALAAVALAVAMQVRPEVFLLPPALVALVLFDRPREWRVLFAWKTLAALGLLAALLLPRLVDLSQYFGNSPAPLAVLPTAERYFAHLIAFDPVVTPPLFWCVAALGAAWTAWKRPGAAAWLLAIVFGLPLFLLSFFDNWPSNVRLQLLANVFIVPLAAGVADAWMRGLVRWPRAAAAGGVAALAAVALGMLLPYTGFVTELRDQQLEWSFLDRTVPKLPAAGRMLAPLGIGGRDLDTFPTFLLERTGKRYAISDARAVARGKQPWPEPSADLLFYQGMYCYFAFHDEPEPEPMTAACLAVQRRYVLEPLHTELLHTKGYSSLRYSGHGERPFLIGFFKVKGLRAAGAP